MENRSAARKLHILMVLENYWPNIGGLENLFKNLVEQLSTKGHRVTIITTRLSREDPAEEVLGNVRILRYRFYNRYFFTLFAFFPVWKHAAHCDLVHTTSYNAALPAFLGGRLRRKKVMITFHEVWASLWLRLPFMGWLAKRLHYLFEQLLLQLSFDCFVGVSHSTSGNLQKAGVSPKLIHTILNGIDYQEFTRKKKDESGTLSQLFTYTYFGRLGVSKGLDLLLDAAEKFRIEYPDSRLRLIIPKVPTGFFRLILREIEKKDLSGYVELRHHLPFAELQDAVRSSDCVVIPSLSEGFCFSAVESIALGVPVISSDQAALKEVVSGRFIKMKEPTSEALVDALRQGREGRWESTPVRQFHLTDTVEGYIRLYNRLLSVKPAEDTSPSILDSKEIY